MMVDRKRGTRKHSKNWFPSRLPLHDLVKEKEN
jgi:hypothetical protein